MSKPKIRKHPVWGWDCEGDGIVGKGSTAYEAYMWWRLAMNMCATREKLRLHAIRGQYGQQI